jgi:hypothetical protein
MRILHRVLVASSPEVRSELARFGIAVSETGFAAFEVDEDDMSWPALQVWIKQRRAADTVSTEFTSSELDEARWLELIPSWHHGYPQPDPENRGFLRATYDLTEYCDVCGSGRKQRAPFQMKSEPKWGRNQILQLNWVFDEYFTTPGLWKEAFAPNGVGCRAVCNTKGVELRGVVQLVIEGKTDIVETALPSETCVQCGRRKFLPVASGPFPALRSEPKMPLAKTEQYFGSGRSTHHRVVISQNLWQELVGRKLRGATVRPVKSVPGDPQSPKAPHQC